MVPERWTARLKIKIAAATPAPRTTCPPSTRERGEARDGKPCIRGIGITVYDVPKSHASGRSEDGIFADFPDLLRTDIRACLHFDTDRARRWMTRTTWNACSTEVSCA